MRIAWWPVRLVCPNETLWSQWWRSPDVQFCAFFTKFGRPCQPDWLVFNATYSGSHGRVLHSRSLLGLTDGSQAVMFAGVLSSDRTQRTWRFWVPALSDIKLKLELLSLQPAITVLYLFRAATACCEQGTGIIDSTIKKYGKQSGLLTQPSLCIEMHVYL